MSVSAWRKIRDALELGRAIPDTWAMDREGRPTTDPAAALEGALLPLGHKGYALGILVDVLAGVLNGAGFGAEIPNTRGGYNTGHFLLAVNVAFFMRPADFKERVDRLIRHLRSIPPVDPAVPVAVPGERAARIQQERLKQGIPVSERLRQRLLRLAAELGVEAGF